MRWVIVILILWNLFLTGWMCRTTTLAVQANIAAVTAGIRISQVYDEMQYYTRPDVVQKRALDWILRQGEFEGEK